MGKLATVTAGIGVAGAVVVIGIGSAATASALAVAPIPGGVQVDLNHADTVWAYQNNVGPAIASIPNPSLQSLGAALHETTWVASQLPAGRVSFTVEGPLNNLGGLIVVLEE